LLLWHRPAGDAIYHPVHWRGDGFPVTISSAAMHTYNMTVGKESRIHKVKRVH